MEQTQKHSISKIDNFPKNFGNISVYTDQKNNTEINFIIRQKPKRGTHDSGFITFPSRTAAETFSTNNLTMLSAQSVLKIDSSIKRILLNAPIGSAFKKEGMNWVEVKQFEFEKDYLFPEPISSKWYFVINKLFVRSKQKESIKFTTYDKTLYLNCYCLKGTSQEELFNDFRIDFGCTHLGQIQEEGFLRKGRVTNYYFLVKSESQVGIEYSICGLISTANSYIIANIHLNDLKDKTWALETLNSINTYNHTNNTREVHCTDSIIDRHEDMNFVDALKAIKELTWYDNTFWVQDFSDNFIQFHGTKNKNEFIVEIDVDVDNMTAFTARISFYELVELIQYYFENDILYIDDRFKRVKI